MALALLSLLACSLSNLTTQSCCLNFSGVALQAICAQRFAQGQKEDVSSNLCVDEWLGINAPRICAGAGRDRVQQFGVDAVTGRRTYISKYQISLFEQ